MRIRLSPDSWAAEQIANSLAASMLLQVPTERPLSQANTLSGPWPAVEAIPTGAYRVARARIWRPPRSPARDRFVAFIRCPVGRAIIRDGDALPLPRERSQVARIGPDRRQP